MVASGPSKDGDDVGDGSGGREEEEEEKGRRRGGLRGVSLSTCYDRLVTPVNGHIPQPDRRTMII